MPSLARLASLALVLASCTAPRHSRRAGPDRAAEPVGAPRAEAPLADDERAPVEPQRAAAAPPPEVGRATAPNGAPPPPPAAEASDLARARELLAASEAAHRAADPTTARARASEALDALLARSEAERDGEWLQLVDRAGSAASSARDAAGAQRAGEVADEVRSRTLPADHPEVHLGRLRLAAALKAQGDLAGARGLEESVLEVFSRTLPDEHPNLQRTRGSLADTLKAQGDQAGVRALRAKLLEVASRTLPEDHHDLQSARLNLASSIKALGDLAGARALEEQALAVFARTLPDDHPLLQWARQCLATTLNGLGDFQGAGELLRGVLDVFSRTLPDEHPTVQWTRLSLAGAIKAQGDLAGALALEESVLDVYARTLPEEHPDLQRARLCVAATVRQLGDLERAREIEERVLEVRTRTLPDEHPDLQVARHNLAVTIAELGDLERARELAEKVIEVLSRTLPDDHVQIQVARLSLAGTLSQLGDREGARALEEKVLEVFSRTLPDEHPYLQEARLNLAAELYAFRDFAGARALEERVLEVYSRTLSDQHPDVQAARSNLAITLCALDDLEGARALLEEVIEVSSRTLPDTHPEVQGARQNLAFVRASLGDVTGARALYEEVLEVNSRTLPDEHPDLQEVRTGLAVALAAENERAPTGANGERCVELLTAQCEAQTRAACSMLLEASPREAETRCRRLVEGLNDALSVVAGLGAFPPSPELERACFVLSETTRGAALGSAAVMRLAASSPRYRELRSELAAESRALATLATAGTTSEGFRLALARREEIERELVALGAELSAAAPPVLEVAVDALADRLEEREALVAYRRYRRRSVTFAPGGDGAAPRQVVSFASSLSAFVLRPPDPSGPNGPGPRLAWVDLGPLEPIEEAVRAWRAAVGVSAGRGMAVAATSPASDTAALGGELRERVFDPLLPALAGAARVVVALDDILHLVPLDALPAPDGAAGEPLQLLGDRLELETRVTLGELLAPAPSSSSADELLVVGGVRYDERREPPEPVLVASTAWGQPEHVLRGGPFAGGFADLPGTRAEADAIARRFAARDAAAAVTLLTEAEATKQSFLRHAPRARWLHVATHGWFAAESIRSWQDSEPIDAKMGLAFRFRRSGAEQVRGMSPMLLCGLALAGASLPEDEHGHAQGLITAAELSALDLSRCELAVLSACDTSAGEQRAGQGVASLQRALQMAGARSAITSLWKVPDEATRELMDDFYRRLWVEGMTKGRALWEAKRWMREARDGNGELLYAVRDWGAWVLTGERD